MATVLLIVAILGVGLLWGIMSTLDDVLKELRAIRARLETPTTEEEQESEERLGIRRDLL